jgi:acyl carrier protein
MEDMVPRVATLLRRVLEDPTLVITADTSILHDVGIDSLHLIRFLLDVEEEFDVEVDFESLDMVHLESVGTFCAFVIGTPVDDDLVSSGVPVGG